MESNHAVLRMVSLTLLTVQNCALGLVIPHSRKPNEFGKRYNAATAVFVVEMGKMIISLSILLVQQMQIVRTAPNSLLPTHNRAVDQYSSSSSASSSNGQGDASIELGSTSTLNEKITLHEDTEMVASSSSSIIMATLKKVKEEILTRDAFQMIVPASLYVVQNNLQLLAASNLSPTSFQIFSQFKIVTTAIFTVLYLRRHLVIQKWIAIVVLTLGIMIFQASQSSISPRQHTISSIKEAIVKPTDGTMGFFLIMIACFISGFAGTYTEGILKGSKKSIWANNFQLSFLSLIPASLPIFYDLFKSFSSPTSTATSTPPPTFAPFDNFTGWAWGVVFLNIVGGLLVAMVVKYADSILKAFTTTVAVILTFIFTYIFMGATFTLPSLFGASLVILAVTAYNRNYGNKNVQEQQQQEQQQQTSTNQYEPIPLAALDADADELERASLSLPDHATSFHDSPSPLSDNSKQRHTNTRSNP